MVRVGIKGCTRKKELEVRWGNEKKWVSIEERGKNLFQDQKSQKGRNFYGFIKRSRSEGNGKSKKRGLRLGLKE